MNGNIIIDWKMVAAIGASVATIMLVYKIKSEEAKEVLMAMINTTNNKLKYLN